MSKKQSKESGLAIALFVLAAILIVIALLLIVTTKSRRVKEQLTIANEYMDAHVYVKAAAAFERAIDIDPKCVEAYSGAADAFVKLAEKSIDKGEIPDAANFYQNAYEVLENGYEMTGDESFADRLEEVEELINELETAAKESEVGDEDSELDDAGSGNTGSDDSALDGEEDSELESSETEENMLNDLNANDIKIIDGVPVTAPYNLDKIIIFGLTLEEYSKMSTDEVQEHSINNCCTFYEVSEGVYESSSVSEEEGSYYLYHDGRISYFANKFILKDGTPRSGREISIGRERILIDYDSGMYKWNLILPGDFSTDADKSEIKSYLDKFGFQYEVVEEDGSTLIWVDVSNCNVPIYNYIIFIFDGHYRSRGEVVESYNGLAFSVEFDESMYH